MTGTAKIAIVEDESHIRALLEQTLEDLEGDFEILTAANGADGLQLIQQEQPCLVFLDIMMPRLNGYDVCAAVRANPALAQTVIVMLTAKGQDADRVRGLEVGADYFVTKPFDPDEVLDLARQILAKELQ